LNILGSPVLESVPDKLRDEKDDPEKVLLSMS